MNTYRKTGIIVGVLFLTATVTGMLGDSLVGSILNAPDYLMNVYPNRTQEEYLFNPNISEETMREAWNEQNVHCK